MANDNRTEGRNLYNQLPKYAETRSNELSSMSGPYIDLTDRYGELLSSLVVLLGKSPPTGSQDIVMRDLLADVFDCLYESRALILAGKLNVAFPVARRAYESLSLLHLCAVDKRWADKWQKGRQVRQADIWKELRKRHMGPPERKMKVLYKFFCSATHPNRYLIPTRFLGDGNEYVLGVIGKPNLVFVVDYCIKIVEMWFWLAAVVSISYKDMIAESNPGYFEDYSKVAKEARSVTQSLVENFNRLLREEREY